MKLDLDYKVAKHENKNLKAVLNKLRDELNGVNKAQTSELSPKSHKKEKKQQMLSVIDRERADNIVGFMT
jgi:hypothetical protein